MDGPLVPLRVQSHTPHDVGAGLGTVLDQGAADRGAGDGREVHWSGVVN